MHNVFVTCPTARGIQEQTSWNIFNMRTDVEKAGHRLHGSSLGRMPLDLARNELMTIFLSTTADLNLMIDDDVTLQPSEGVVTLIKAIDGGCDIVTAPCRMRSEGHLFNVVPTTMPKVVGGVRVVECAWTGLGAVMVKRGVFERLRELGLEKSKLDRCPACGERALESYRSLVMPEHISTAVFKSRVEEAKRFFVEAPEDENVYLLDDRVFSLKAIEAGFKIHAAIDVATVHDGLRGCFADELEKIDRARAGARPNLMGADGRPLT